MEVAGCGVQPMGFSSFQEFKERHPDIAKLARAFAEEVVAAQKNPCHFLTIVAAAKRHSAFPLYWGMVEKSYAAIDAEWGQSEGDPLEDFLDFSLFLVCMSSCAGGPIALAPAMQDLSKTCQFPPSVLAGVLEVQGSSGGRGEWRANSGSNGGGAGETDKAKRWGDWEGDWRHGGGEGQWWEGGWRHGGDEEGNWSRLKPALRDAALNGPNSPIKPWSQIYLAAELKNEASNKKPKACALAALSDTYR